MTATVRREAPNHDTTTCFTKYKCRRPACVERYNANERERKRLKKQGDYQRFADAAPVRAHVLQLIAGGATPYGISRQSGASDTTVRGLLPRQSPGRHAPLRHRMLAENAAKLLALAPEDVIPRYTPALGTVRRIQALVANGWPMISLGEHVGLYPKYVGELVGKAGRGETRVWGTTALAVARAYDTLRGRKPTRHGVDKAAAAYARDFARDRDWPPSRYWDEFPGAIDDPHFTPEYGKTRLEILAEDGVWAMTGGSIDRELIAERLGVDRSYLDKALAAHAAPLTGVAA